MGAGASKADILQSMGQVDASNVALPEATPAAPIASGSDA